MYTRENYMEFKAKNVNTPNERTTGKLECLKKRLR